MGQALYILAKYLIINNIREEAPIHKIPGRNPVGIIPIWIKKKGYVAFC